MDNEALVKSIRDLCKLRDLNISQLEKDLNFGAGLISRWSKSDPSLSKIIDIADYFNVSLDRVAGYDTPSDDEFVEKLISQTASGKLKWNKYNPENPNPKFFHNPYAKNQYDDSKGGYHKIFLGRETSFYTCVKSGYISLYSYHEYHNVKRTAAISLFIQADDNSELIGQNYSTRHLIPLWLKVLYALKEDAPDDIKAEELKNAFLSDID